MDGWAVFFILSYDNERYFKRVSFDRVENLFIDWLIEQFGERDFSKSYRLNRWELFSTVSGEAYGVKVVFKNKDDAMLFKLTWL